MSSQLTGLYLSLLDFLDPLRRRLQAPEALEYLLYRYGWNVTLDDAAFARIKQGLAVVEPLEAFVSTAEDLRQKQTANPDADLSGSDLTSLAQSAAVLIRALAEFKMSDPSGLADPLARAGFWESIAENVFDDLLEEYLRIHQPGFYLVLRVWGVVRFEMTVPAEDSRQPYTRTIFDWGQALAVTKDPLEALKRAYHWGDPTQPFAHEAALDSLGSVVHALGAPAASIVPALAVKTPIAPTGGKGIANDVAALRVILLQEDWPADHAFYSLGFEVFPAIRPGEVQPTGLVVKPILEGGAGKTLPIGKSLALTWSVAASLDDVIGFAMFPGEADLVGGAPAIGTSLVLSTAGQGPWYLLGGAKTSRIEIAGFSAGVSLAGAIDDPEIKLLVASAGPNGEPGCRIVVSLDDADEFVSTATKQSGLDFSFSPEIVWSSKSGFSFNGKPNVDLVLPLSVNLGPVSLTDVSIKFGEGAKTTSAASLTCRIGVGVRAKLGPIGFVIEGIGFACTVVPHSSGDVRALPAGADPPALGGIGVDLDFAPPTGLGLSVDAPGISGGGYIGHDGDTYSGALDLSICDIAVKVYGLIQTRLPGGAAGYSALVVLSAEFSPGIQLGYGFTLDGVGGLLGINRTLALANVESAVWSGQLDGLLFPKDPATAAPSLMAAIGSYFPAASGRYLFGPLAKIGWDNGIVEAMVGLIIEVPEPIKLVLIGEVDVLVPKKASQLVLKIDFAGGIDFGQKLAFFDASLHDSRIERYPLLGDLAFRYGWGDNPVFGLAIGGFHPHYQPPANFPALKRMSVAIGASSVQLTATAYLALTSNSLQFGARVELTAGASSLNVHGWIGFDALVERDPFSLAFDLSAGVDLRSGTTTLASVHLSGSVTGPSPWHVSADASISCFFFDISVHVDKQWGDSAPALPADDPVPLVIAAFADPSAWSSTLPASVTPIVTLADRPPDATGVVLLDPAGGLRIAQRVVPLGQAITRFGGTPLGASRTLTMESVNVFGDTSPTPTTEEFAIAQFEDLTDDEKLSVPSFSRLNAGIEAGGSGVDLGNGSRTRAVITSAEYDTTIIDAPNSHKPGKVYLPTALAQAAMNLRFAAFATPPPLVGLTADQYIVATTTDLGARVDIQGDGSKRGALVALASYLASNPGARGELQVVLSGETT